MKKSQKILLSTLLPVSLAGMASTLLLATSCSASKTTDFNEETFEKNANKKYLDLAGTKLTSEQNEQKMETVSLAKSILGTKDGMKQYIESYSDVFLVDWFSKTRDPILSTFYNDEFKAIKDEFDENKKSYTDMNLFQRKVLDPTGGTENTYIFQKLLPKLKAELSTNLFAKDYLAIKGSNDEIIKLDSQSTEAMNAIKNTDYINGSSAGKRNNFIFHPKATDSYNEFDDYYVDFINFIFEEWTKDTLPIVTPSVLFKHSSGVSPKDAGLFNIAEFGASALDGNESNYKFQWFEPSNNDYKNPNSSMKYQTFVEKMDSFINTTTGAIQIDKYLTDDSSTLLITNGKTCYSDFVAPFAAAAMFNFSEYVLGNTDIKALPSSNLNATDIMSNFISSSENDTTNGYFKLPYTTASAFSGAYKDIKSIRDTFRVANKPFVATRDQFGVHIIGIDRYSKIQEAAATQSDASSKMAAALVEIQNTILWRAAQKIILDTNYDVDKITLDLKSTLKTYFDSNVSKLIYKYLQKNNVNQNNNIPGGREETNQPTESKHLFSNETIEQGRNPLLNITDPNDKECKLMDAMLTVDNIKTSMDFINTVNEKMYSNQSSYSSNQKVSDWKTYGLAGVMPFERNEQTANFDQLINISVKPIKVGTTTYNDSETIEQKYTKAKQILSNSIEQLDLKPASTDYFNGKVGKQLGVSQYTFVNNWIVNQILIKDTSDSTVVDIYNLLWDNKNVDVDLVRKLKENNGKTEAVGLSFNESVASELKSQIRNNYIIKAAFDSQAQKAQIPLKYDNYTELENTSNELIKEKFINNLLGANSQISYSDNAEFKTFLKSLTWLLSPSEKTEKANSDGPAKNIYTYKNLIKLLKEIIDNEDTGVAYLGWIAESTIFAKDQFGNDQNADFSYKSNPMYINNINSYSYFGAPNPLNAAAGTTYYGNNSENYFNTAPVKKASGNKTTANQYNGFIGFQSSDSNLFSSTLPAELFTGTLLTQDPTNQSNYKGLFYRFNNTEQSSTYSTIEQSRANMKAFYENDSFKMVSIAKQILLYGFNILTDPISFENETYNIKQILNMVINGATISNKPISFEQRKIILNQIVDKVPEIAFQQLNGESLTRDKNGTSSRVFEGSDGTLKQYIVSQFNMYDIINFENKIDQLSEQSSINDLTFANLDTSTFYAAIVLLAQNKEIQSRANAYWSTITKENKITVYNYNVARKLGETVVKNWDDFKE